MHSLSGPCARVQVVSGTGAMVGALRGVLGALDEVGTVLNRDLNASRIVAELRVRACTVCLEGRSGCMFEEGLRPGVRVDYLRPFLLLRAGGVPDDSTAVPRLAWLVSAKMRQRSHT